MELNGEQQKKLTSWVAQYGKDYVCPFCGENNFGAGYIISPLTMGTLMGTEEVTVPLATIVCNSCGHVTFFAAAHIGLVDSQ